MAGKGLGWTCVAETYILRCGSQRVTAPHCGVDTALCALTTLRMASQCPQQRADTRASSLNGVHCWFSGLCSLLFTGRDRSGLLRDGSPGRRPEYHDARDNRAGHEYRDQRHHEFGGGNKRGYGGNQSGKGNTGGYGGGPYRGDK